MSHADDVNIKMNGEGDQNEEVDFAKVSQARAFEILGVRCAIYNRGEEKEVAVEKGRRKREREKGRGGEEIKKERKKR